MPLDEAPSRSGYGHSTFTPRRKLQRRLSGLRMATCPMSKRSVNGVLEYKIDFGPGYRLYFGRDGERLIILLAGGTKNANRGHPHGKGELGRLLE
jgi:putative addiction module killer protein